MVLEPTIISEPTIYDFNSLTYMRTFDLNLGHFHPLDTLGILICCSPYF